MIEIALVEHFYGKRLREEPLPASNDYPISEARQPTCADLERLWTGLAQETRATLVGITDGNRTVTRRIEQEDKIIVTTAAKRTSRLSCFPTSSPPRPGDGDAAPPGRSRRKIWTTLHLMRSARSFRRTPRRGLSPEAFNRPASHAESGRSGVPTPRPHVWLFPKALRAFQGSPSSMRFRVRPKGLRTRNAWPQARRVTYHKYSRLPPGIP